MSTQHTSCLYGREAIAWIAKGDGVWDIDYELIRRQEQQLSGRDLSRNCDLDSRLEELFGEDWGDPFVQDSEASEPESLINRMIERYGERIVVFDGVSQNLDVDEATFLAWMREMFSRGEHHVEVGAVDLQCPFEYNRAVWIARHLCDKGTLKRIGCGNYALRQTVQVNLEGVLCEDCEEEWYWSGSKYTLHDICAARVSEAFAKYL